MRKTLLASLLSSMLLAGQALAAQPDLTNTAAFENTCAGITARPPATMQERQAWVICNDVALVQQTRTFIEQGLVQYQRKQSEESLALAIREQLTHMREQLRKSRAMLEKIRITSAKDGLLIAPATWVRDLDGNGTISTSERYFFAIPTRNDGSLAFRMPSEDEEYYAREYNLDATIRLDQTDILWGLSYHYYVEAIVEVLLSYQYRRDADTRPDQVIRLAHPENMRRARELIVAGLKTSEMMRLSALAETDDDMEWLGNPRQASSAFPLPLDDADYRIWGELMGHLLPLFQGRTLLTPSARQGGVLGSLGSLCPAGKGISLQSFFQQPPKYPLEFFNRPDTQLYCRKVDAAHPASGLFAFMAKYAQAVENGGGAGMRFLRRLLWVN